MFAGDLNNAHNHARVLSTQDAVTVGLPREVTGPLPSLVPRIYPNY